jgi:hypothetical protein
MESEIFYQEHHDKDKEPSIDIHEAISHHQLADVIRKTKEKWISGLHQPFSHLCFPQTFSQM